MIVVYYSNTGFSQRYAEMLAEKIGVAVYSLHEGKKRRLHGEPIIFIGSLMAGIINGLKEASDFFNIKVLVGVGMSFANENSISDLRSKNNIEDTIPVFYLQGGLDLNKLHGIKKLMLNMMRKQTLKTGKGPDGKELSPAELDLFAHGGNFVSQNNLSEIVQWIVQNY